MVAYPSLEISIVNGGCVIKLLSRKLITNDLFDSPGALDNTTLFAVSHLSFLAEGRVACVMSILKRETYMTRLTHSYR